MARRLVLVVAVAMVLTVVLGGTTTAAPPDYTPGAPGIGDPYFPLAGNGGYDVEEYRLDVRYDPDTDVLSGVALITARATQDLSSFNLDLDGLEVAAVTVNGRPAEWSRAGGELTITPVRGIRERSRFRTEITYEGVPETLDDGSGFIHTDDGALVIGEPQVAATWFPVNDHPSDKASFTFHITVPEGLEAVANGVLRSERTRDGWTTWSWTAREPMAPYLSTATIGEFDLRAYAADGIRYWDALDPDLFASAQPRTGEQFALSQVGDLSYKRLARTISVPDDGAELSFWVQRATELGYDFLFVEAHTAGEDDWTTLPDLGGRTSQDDLFFCPFWWEVHPFLTHYITDEGDGTCSPTGTTGEFWAASGTSDGYEQWTVDLRAYAGSDVEVAITYASDESFQEPGVVLDDITVSTGEGTTSFENDGDPLDGWTVPGAPPGSEPNPNDWIVGTADDTPPTIGDVAEASLARQPEIIAFLSELFGPYPFSAAGGIVDDADIGFALENQTRPIYSYLFFGDQTSGDSVVVHELAHQWYGDSLAVEAWQHIWLNEGFATYAEWLWSEREGLGTAQQIFDFLTEVIPADDPFWSLTIGDPGPDDLFDGAVYDRGAMTLHALRLEVGDEAFFEIIRTWAQSEEGGTVTTDEFIALAEDRSGAQLDELFDLWLFTPAKPVGLGDAAAAPSPQGDVLTSAIRRP